MLKMFEPFSDRISAMFTRYGLQSMVSLAILDGFTLRPDRVRFRVLISSLWCLPVVVMGTFATVAVPPIDRADEDDDDDESREDDAGHFDGYRLTF